MFVLTATLPVPEDALNCWLLGETPKRQLPLHVASAPVSVIGLKAVPFGFVYSFVAFVSVSVTFSVTPTSVSPPENTQKRLLNEQASSTLTTTSTFVWLKNQK